MLIWVVWNVLVVPSASLWQILLRLSLWYFLLGPKNAMLSLSCSFFLDYKMTSKCYNANMLISCIVNDGHLIMDLSWNVTMATLVVHFQKTCWVHNQGFYLHRNLGNLSLSLDSIENLKKKKERMWSGTGMFTHLQVRCAWAHVDKWMEAQQGGERRRGWRWVWPKIQKCFTLSAFRFPQYEWVKLERTSLA